MHGKRQTGRRLTPQTASRRHESSRNHPSGCATAATTGRTRSSGNGRPNGNCSGAAGRQRTGDMAGAWRRSRGRLRWQTEWHAADDWEPLESPRYAVGRGPRGRSRRASLEVATKIGMGIPPSKSCYRGAHAHRRRSWPSPTRRWGHAQRDRRPGGSLPGRGDEARRCCFHERRGSGRHRSGQGPAIGRARLRAQPSSEPPGPHALRMACRLPAEFVPSPRTPRVAGPPPILVRRRPSHRAEDAREHLEAAPVVGDR